MGVVGATTEDEDDDDDDEDEDGEDGDHVDVKAGPTTEVVVGILWATNEDGDNKKKMAIANTIMRVAMMAMDLMITVGQSCLLFFKIA